MSEPHTTNALNELSLSKPRAWCEVCFHLNENLAIESGQAVASGDYDELPHLSSLGLEDTVYRIHGTLRLFKESASGCRFCRFLGAVADEFMPAQDVEGDALVVYLEEDCVYVEFRPREGERLPYVYLYRPADTVSEQSASISGYEHIPVLPDIDVPKSDNSFNYLKRCLQTCVETHARCKQDMTSPPKRLLRVGSPGDTAISLYETPDGFRDSYVALSYCWGTGENLKTLTSNIDSLKSGFDLARLPAALRDAIRVTRDLGVGYIWIDALCIIQDSKADWADQAARMCSIYEQAYLTIAAASSDDAATSFIKHTDRPRTLKYSIPDEENGTSDVILAARVECTSGHHYNPTGRVLKPPENTLTRGWCLQESILATRCISYSTDELQWRCREGAKCECEMPADWRRDITIIHDSDSDSTSTSNSDDDENPTTIEFWNQVLEQYTQRALTHGTDKLPALSGICQLITRRDPNTAPRNYLAGLWEHDMPYNLLWERAADINRSDVPIPAVYRAPSFSWASLDCTVYPFMDFLNVYPSARVIGSSVRLASKDPFGQVERGASITVLGKVVRDVVLYDVNMYNDGNEGRGGSEKRFAGYRVQLRDKGRGTLRDEDIVADGLLEGFGYVDLEGRVRRSVRRLVGNRGERGRLWSGVW